MVIKYSSAESYVVKKDKNGHEYWEIDSGKDMRLIPSLEDILLHSNVNWQSPDHKNHKLFKKRGFENYRGRVRIDNVIFNTIVRVGKARFGEVFYDINLEVDSYLPHTNNSASDINESTSMNSISDFAQKVKTSGKNSSKNADLGGRSALATNNTRLPNAIERVCMQEVMQLLLF